MTPRNPMRIRTGDAVLEPGRSFDGCSVVLLPKDASPGRVRFQGDVAKGPVYWGTGTDPRSRSPRTSSPAPSTSAPAAAPAASTSVAPSASPAGPASR